MSLTPRQHQVLSFIAKYQRERRGVSPTFREIATAIGAKSHSNVYHHVVGLAERGYLRHTRPNRHRFIEILKLPDDIAEDLLRTVSTRSLLHELDRRGSDEVERARHVEPEMADA